MSKKLKKTMAAVLAGALVFSMLPAAGPKTAEAAEPPEPTAHYDMSHEGTALKDISGEKNDATLYNTEDGDFAVYGNEEVLQFNNEQYATIPRGVIDDAASFTVQAVVSAPTTSDNWVWCFGDGIGEWGAGNIGDYIFVSANSAQSSYNGTVLGAVKADGEARMPVPSQSLGGGYTAITLVSDERTLTLYMNGVEVSYLEHGKDVSEVIPDGDILGYIGQSLYSPDKKLIANVADIKIWNTALDAETVAAAAPTLTDKQNMLLADIQKALLNGNASVDDIIGDVAFPTSVDGVSLTWNIPENNFIEEDGTVTVPEKDETVEVSVSYTCYGEENTETFTLTVKREDIDRILNEAEASLDIPNKDDVRGNITLPEETESGVQITWTAAPSGIVDVAPHASSVPGYDETPAGVVTRPAEDTAVTMTATLTYKGQIRTKKITLNVKAAPKQIEESDYTDYFFAYFAGEGFSDGEQIYFASSQDGLNWDDLNNNQPVLTSTLGEQGVRDPFIIRSPEGDKFYLIATDLKIYGNGDWNGAQNSGSQSLMVWESTDLVNWSDQRMVEVSAEIGAGCTWAPEATYDELTGEYVVYWASRTPAVDNKQRVYYAKTRDFYTFTDPQLFIDYDESCIDTTILYENGKYYRYTKNEGGATNDLGALTKTVFAESSDTLLGNYTQISAPSLNNYQWVEGPAIFKLNNDDQTATQKYCLLVDENAGIGYYPLLTADLDSGNFTKPADDTYKMPSRARHGTPIRVTAEEYQRIMEAYATPEEVNTVTYAGETPDLPETVTIDNGYEQVQKNVTWNLSGVSFDGEAFSSVTVTGAIEDSQLEAVANVRIIPKNIEYMIDCNNSGSGTWTGAKSLNSALLNSEAADQAKTADNTWGYTSVAGSEEPADITGYSQNDINNPYTGGWWARGNKNITYQVTLPAGEHTIMLGCNGWWNVGRQMDVFYSIDGGAETKLCDLDAVASQEVSASGTITLDKKSVVTLTVRKADGKDPILSWIAVSGTPAQEPVDLTELKEAVDSAKAYDGKEADYTAASYKAMQDALDAAEVQLETPESQEKVNAAADELTKAVDNLVYIKDLRDYINDHSDYTEGKYTEDSYAAYEKALQAAKDALGKTNATQDEVDTALQNLKDAVTGLEEKPGTEVSKDALQNLYDQYKDIKQGNYTDESYAAFRDALQNAKNILDKADASQKEVDAAYNALKNAKDALTEKTDTSDTPSGTDDPDKAPQTGDNTNIVGPVVGVVIALILAAAIVIIRKKRK